MTEEGGAAHTLNLRKRCYKERRLKEGEEEVSASKWRELVEQESITKEATGSIWHGTSRAQNVVTFFYHQKKLGPEQSWQTRKSVRQNGTGGRRQHETPYKEELDLARHSTDPRLEGVSVRRANNAVKSGDWANFWEEFLGKGKLSRWAGAKVRECHSEVEQEDRGRLLVAQDISRQNTDFSRRIIVPVEEQGGVTLSYVCPHCHCCPLEDCIRVGPFRARTEVQVVCGLRQAVRLESSK